MLTQEEIELLVQLLNRCEPGHLPPAVFESIGRITVYPAVEFVLLRRKENHIEVLLFPRPVNDPVWPGMLHLPGTVIRATDKTAQRTINRLVKDELKGIKVSKPHFTGVHFNSYKRGESVGLEYWLEVYSNSSDAVFYDVENLPSNFIAEQSPILTRAVASFESKYKLE